MFDLLCTEFGTAPSTDGSFINIAERWWHQGLFNTSMWVEMDLGPQIYFECALLLQSSVPECFHQRLCHKSDTFRWQSPQRMPFSKLKYYYAGVNAICFSDTVRTEIKDNESLFLGNTSFILWIMKVWIVHEFQRCPPILKYQESVGLWIYLKHSTVTLAVMDTILWFRSLKIIIISNLGNQKKTDFGSCICSPGRKRLIKCPSWESTRELPSRSNTQNKSARQSPTEFWIPTSKHE